MPSWACAACGEAFDEPVSFCSACGSDEIARTDVPDATADSRSKSGEGRSEVDDHTVESESGRRSVPGRTPPGARTDEPPTAPPGTESSEEPAAAPGSASEPTSTERSTGENVLLGGVGATVIGAFLPWASISQFGASVTARGIEGDGRLTAAAAILVGVLYVAHWTRRAKLGSLALSVLVALLALVYINDPAFGIDTADAETVRTMANVGVGLYLTAVGGAAMAYGSYRELQRG